MKWSEQAEAAIRNVPFFVRKRVRARVEKEAAEAGRREVCLADVKATQARYLKKMSSEVKGYQVDACFGGSGCPHRAINSDDLVGQIERIMAQADLLTFLRSRVKGDLKFHHEFRVSIADCPNACSQPQIKDVGIIGAATPTVGETPCNACGACRESCKEMAIISTAAGEVTGIDPSRCVQCGSCLTVCPTGTLVVEEKGYRVLIGGKLGRHPRLARELPGIFNAPTVLRMLSEFVALYKRRSTHGERFAHLLTDTDIDALAARWSSQQQVAGTR